MNIEDPNLFDVARARELQALGIAKVSSWPNDNWVGQAREVAVKIAEQYGRVTADDIHREFPPPKEANPSIMGAVFKEKRLMFVGIEPSKRKSRHGSTNKVYALRQQGAQ